MRRTDGGTDDRRWRDGWDGATHTIAVIYFLTGFIDVTSSPNGTAVDTLVRGRRAFLTLLISGLHHADGAL